MLNKYTYKITPLAVSDMEEALDYIAENLHNQKASNDLYMEILKTIDNICLFPESHEDCSSYGINDDNIRRALVDNYVLVYEIIQELKQINILRFRFARMDLSKLYINR